MNFLWSLSNDQKTNFIDVDVCVCVSLDKYKLANNLLNIHSDVYLRQRAIC